ncbi:MAG TPA: 16S rRNA (cytosine(1402)-N(4))-methyltransferase [Parvularcula sp.]|nr:16S rRNA (cytosine(1402)-N(4))-methyltransferase [Parvularcula sp.]HBS30689.1 16S rRNA (cytosine(1402)-N(4))-methyltransferase [Parvularcula sp.]HBS36236.1 16S rRNA (cytosine(1402)-N(4))-methyltransferase [Parvularcula sp.]
MTAPHAPVMAEEAVDALDPRDGGVYADGTFGAGGYARRILDRADCSVYGFDRDPSAIECGRGLEKTYGGRLHLVPRPFGDIAEALEAAGVSAIDGAVFDLGVSSMQLDEADRGFSFMRDGPLSMRMDKGKPDAADVVNAAEANDLAQIFRAYGEENRAGRIARAIVAERAGAPIVTTLRLAEIIARAAPGKREDKIHPATRAFQGLRIFVNDELGQLAKALFAAERLLRPAGRLVIVTFHSLEDRIVKSFFVERSGRPSAGSRHAPSAPLLAPTFNLITAKPQAPSAAEIAANPRARSAKLRAAARSEAPARGGDPAEFLPAFNFSRAMSKLGAFG